MRKFLKWAAITVGALVVIGFFAFLYLIPPFTLAPPETFSRAEADAAPSLESIQPPAERAIAERGKYIVKYTGCAGCHTPGGDSGPKWNQYLAGGLKFSVPGYGTSITRNLTPDSATGLGMRTDDQIKRTLRSGVFGPTGRVFYPTMMPWANFSNWTEEDRHAVVVFLRHLKPVHHRIPDHVDQTNEPAYTFYGLDYAIEDSTR